MCLGVFSLIKNIAHCVGAVGSGNGVGHGEQRGNAACRRCIAARDDIFFFGLTRIAQMHMHVYKTRHGAQSVRVNYPVN